MTEVKCEVCNKRFKRITHKHLKHHNMTLQQYVNQYPKAQLISDDTRSKLRTNTLEHWIDKHGEVEGPKRYKEYCNFLAEKNTSNYKQKHLGWTKEQVAEYNKSRSSTLENFIKRHGMEKGTTKWDDYCKKQKYVGVKLEYFIEKHGEEQGTEIYKELLKKKVNSSESFIKRYGEELGIEKYKEYLNKKRKHFQVSKPHKLLIDIVDQILSQLDIECTIHSAVHNKEFVSYDNTNKKCWMYDVVITDPLKVCIELDGDYWHCNPSVFSSYDTRFDGMRAEDVWEQDVLKEQHLINRGFKVFRIYESTLYNDPNKTKQVLEQWFKNLLKQK